MEVSKANWEAQGSEELPKIINKNEELPQMMISLQEDSQDRNRAKVHQVIKRRNLKENTKWSKLY